MSLLITSSRLNVSWICQTNKLLLPHELFNQIQGDFEYRQGPESPTIPNMPNDFLEGKKTVDENRSGRYYI